MYRMAIEELQSWKTKKNRKPLIIRGARQVGKTWLMKAFGVLAYEKVVYINFKNNRRMQMLFEGSLEVERLIIGLELYAGHKIVPDNTLLIFDEIQECPNALASLRCFNEDASQYQIICAGILIGEIICASTFFSIGKVEFLDLFPLSFVEFMLAMGKEQYVYRLQENNFEMVRIFKQDYVDLLKYYCYVGGMPEVVQRFIENRDFNEVRKIQRSILTEYEQAFSKNAPNDVALRIRMIWDSIPAQLTKGNKKFIYSSIKEGARAKEYEEAMFWLTSSGLVQKIYRVVTPEAPLKAHEDTKVFRLFLVDVGLLSCLIGVRQEILLDGNELFEKFKGALTKQYVLQQLKTLKDIDIYYWIAERGTAEVNFVIDIGNDIIPIEVNSEINRQAKSLKVYRDKFQPRLSIRTAVIDYRKEDQLLNLPLWAIEEINKLRFTK